jgi:hypothetical protein
MSTARLQPRCWNHETRDAVCRCPGCSRSFCRECVTEHEARLLCSHCLEEAAQGASAARPKRRLAGLWMTVAGLLLAWLVFYGTGQALILVTGRMEQTAWQDR